MLTLEGLIAVISKCLTAFGLGYAIGCNQIKARPPSIYKGFQAFVYYSNSQIKSYHYTFLYRDYCSIWFYMCSTVQSPQTVLKGVIKLLSGYCYHSYDNNI